MKTRPHPPAVLLLLLLAGCGSPPPPPPPDPDPRPVQAAGLHNVFRVSDRLFSGSSPDSEEGFATLERLGVKTILSVDGAAPDAAAAGRHGMRYVHLPVGYDGIPRGRGLQLAKAVRDLPGPVYVHCHHGKHRGPAACAVIQLTLDPAWTPAAAERWLKAAGTDAKYSGLFALSHTHHPASVAELDAVANDFPTAAAVPDLVRLMVDVDLRWDHLKAVKAAGWATPPDHPDLDPPHEAVMLAEHYREAARLGEATARGREFVKLLAEGEGAADELAKSLRAKDGTAATAAFARSQAACAACHDRYRDRK